MTESTGEGVVLVSETRDFVKNFQISAVAARTRLRDGATTRH